MASARVHRFLRGSGFASCIKLEVLLRHLRLVRLGLASAISESAVEARLRTRSLLVGERRLALEMHVEEPDVVDVLLDAQLRHAAEQLNRRRRRALSEYQLI